MSNVTVQFLIDHLILRVPASVFLLTAYPPSPLTPLISSPILLSPSVLTTGHDQRPASGTLAAKELACFHTVTFIFFLYAFPPNPGRPSLAGLCPGTRESCVTEMRISN